MCQATIGYMGFLAAFTIVLELVRVASTWGSNQLYELLGSRMRSYYYFLVGQAFRCFLIATGSASSL